LAMSIATMGLYYRIIPYTHYLLRAMVFNDAQELLYSLLKKHHEIKYSNFPYQIFVKDVKDKKLIEPIFKRKDENGVITWVAHAREAELQVRPSAGQVDVLVKHCVVWGDNSSGVLEDKPLTVELPKDFGKQTQPRPRDLTWQEIVDRRQQLQKEIEAIRVNASNMLAYHYVLGITEKLPHLLESCRNKINVAHQEIVALDVEVQMRPALSLGCLFFILVGCPVGIWFSRSDYLSAFITCFLPIVFVYYPLMLCGTGMAKEAKINMIPLFRGADPNMVLLVWGADAVVGLIGVILFWRLLKN
jgi:lipopolysaccharide export system permease protein